MRFCNQIIDDDVFMFHVCPHLSTTTMYNINMVDRSCNKFAKDNKEYVMSLYWKTESFLSSKKNTIVTTTYKDGKIDNIVAARVKTGNIVMTQQYKDGVKHGLYESRTIHGTLYTQVYYKNGFMDGERLCYYPSGVLFYTSQFKHGLLDGKNIYYNILGDITVVKMYKKGVLVTREVVGDV